MTLDRLGGEAWQRRKSRMKERIREIAGDLIKVAAERALRPGAVLEPDTGFAAFADRFPYEETEDQDRAIADVIGDLAAGKPMDRLVCGDVGFGKTEVALRAAFIAAMAGLQVALIAPTTLLARQHFNTFKERFQGFPIEIGRLSRLVPAEGGEGDQGGARRRARSTSSSAPTRCSPRASSSRSSAWSSSTRSSASASPTRSG